MKPLVTVEQIAALDTPQKVFDYVAGHLKQQGVQSRTIEGCVYRGEFSRMCGAGCLIPDKHYQPEFEGSTIHKIMLGQDGFEEDHPVISKNIELVKRFQRLHDSDMPSRIGMPDRVLHYNYELLQLADEHKLIVNPEFFLSEINN